jgi:hypothetical protein
VSCTHAPVQHPAGPLCSQVRTPREREQPGSQDIWLVTCPVVRVRQGSATDEPRRAIKKDLQLPHKFTATTEQLDQASHLPYGTYRCCVACVKLSQLHVPTETAAWLRLVAFVANLRRQGRTIAIASRRLLRTRRPYHRLARAPGRTTPGTRRCRSSRVGRRTWCSGRRCCGTTVHAPQTGPPQPAASEAHVTAPG